MSKWHVRATALACASALVTAGAVVAASPAAAVGGNLLSNPGFENASESPWIRWGNGSPGCTHGLSTSWSRSGSKSFHLADSGTGVSCGVYQEVSAVAGAEYVAKAYVNMTSGTAVQVYLDFRDSSGNRVGLEYGTNEFTTGVLGLSASGVAPAGTAKAQVWVYVPTSHTADVYVDDASLDLVAATNSLSNPGFENASESPWIRWGDGSPGCTHGLSTSWSRSGLKSFHLADSGTGVSCGVYQQVSGVAGLHYVAKAYVNMTSGTAAQVYLDFRDSLGDRIGLEYATNKDTGTFGLSASGVAPAGTAAIQVWVYVPTSHTADVYVDDVSLKLV